MNENQETKLLSPEEIAELLLRKKEVRRQTDSRTIEGLATALGLELSNKILRECQAELASAKREGQ